MAKNIRTIVLIVIGVISIGLSIRCFSFKEMDSAEKDMYGGDAFTGIQNAGAQTSENVKNLAKIVQFGFGSVLLIAGFGFLGIGLTTPLGKENLEANVNSIADTSAVAEETADINIDNQKTA